MNRSMILNIMLLSTTLCVCQAGEEIRPISPAVVRGSWVYDSPPEVQIRTISIRVRIVDEALRTIPNAQVIGYCEPWHYSPREMIHTDQMGEAVIRGPVGEWTFYVGTAGYLAKASFKLEEDARVTIRSQGETRIRFNSRDSSRINMNRSRRGKKRSRTNLYFKASDRVPMLFIGSLTGETLRLSTMKGIKGSLRMVRDMEEGSAGLVMACPFDTSDSQMIAAFPQRPARLEIDFDGFHTEAKAIVSVYSIGSDKQVGSSAFAVPPGGGQSSLLLNPGTYRIEVGYLEICQFLGKRVTLRAGETKRLRFGNKLSIKPLVLVWNPNRLHLWFDIRDNYGTALVQVNMKDETVDLVQGDEVFHSGPSPQGRTRHFRIDRDWTPTWKLATDLHYSYRASYPPFGVIEQKGTIAADHAQSPLNGNIPISASSEHFEIRFLDCPPEVAAGVAEALEKAFSWLSSVLLDPCPVARNTSGLFSLYLR